MPKTSNRLDRIGDLICQELASLIRTELRDPRLGMVSVIDARVSRDLSHADIYVTVMGADIKDSVATLNHASGYLRNFLAKNINLRSTPKLSFRYDETIERGRQLSGLIDEALAQDAEHPHDEESDSVESDDSSSSGSDDASR